MGNTFWKEYIAGHALPRSFRSSCFRERQLARFQAIARGGDYGSLAPHDRQNLSVGCFAFAPHSRHVFVSGGRVGAAGRSTFAPHPGQKASSRSKRSPHLGHESFSCMFYPYYVFPELGGDAEGVLGNLHGERGLFNFSARREIRTARVCVPRRRSRAAVRDPWRRRGI
jgi:hypothetical protein